MIRIFYILLLLTFLFLNMLKTEETAQINIFSNVEKAKIFFDNYYIGKVPLMNYKIQPGKYKIIVTYPNEYSWYNRPIVDSITIGAGEVATKFIELEFVYLINTQPSNADVYYKDSLLGKTPLVIYSKSTSLLITLKKDGYKEVDYIIQNSSLDNYFILEPVMTPSNLILTGYLSNEKKRNNLAIYLSSGSTVVFGVSAAWFKIKADNYYNQYQYSGDKNVLNKVKKYDKISGISLAACQISNFMLAYFLLSI